MEIVLDKVTKRFADMIAVNNVSLAFKDQSFTCVYGPPGAGKSTLLRLIAGLEWPDEGRILMRNKDVTPNPPMVRGVSYIAQEFALYPHMNVYRNIAYPLRIMKLKKEEINQRVKESAKFLKIDHLLDRMPVQLSGGEQQRVAIARGLVKHSEVYVFDEPLTNLDYKIREDMRSEFRRFQKELGQTIIYATGDPLEALSLSEFVVIMNEGQIVDFGETSKIYLEPSNLFTIANFGYPTANLFKGNMERENVFRGDLFSIKCHFPVESGIEAVAAVRPEDLRVVDFKPSDRVLIEGTVFLSDIIGSENVIYVKPRGLDYQVKVLANRNFRPSIDTDILLQMDPEKILFYSVESKKYLGKGGLVIG